MFNSTFLVEMVAFIIFVAICMKFIWPPIISSIESRQKEIADSLESAKQANQELELAKVNATKIIDSAKGQAQEIIDAANKRGAVIIDDAQVDAKSERDRIIKSAQAEIEAERNRTMEDLRKEISSLAVAGAQKIIESKLDEKTSAALVDKALDNL